MTKQKILITGASGMLGRVLCNILAKDYEILGLDLKNRGKIKHFYKCDISKFQQVKKAILKITPDIVIHTAAYTDVDGCQKNVKKAYVVNAKGTINIAKVIRNSDAVLFFISTDYVFNGCKKTPYNEEDRPSPLNVYGKSKLDAERFIQANLRKYFIIRTSWLYGVGGKNFVDTIRSAAQSNPLLKVVDNQIGAPTFVVDLSDALRNLLREIAYYPERYYSGIYHITNSGKCSWYQFAKEILRISGISAKVEPIKSSQLSRPAQRPKNSLLSNSKFNRLTHKPMRHWKEALCAYIKS